MEIVDLFNNFRDTLQSHNISIPVLLVGLGFFGLGFLLSSRELVLWFFKISAVHKDVSELRSQMQRMETDLHEIRNAFVHREILLPEENKENKTPAKVATKESPKTFRIFH